MIMASSEHALPGPDWAFSTENCALKEAPPVTGSIVKLYVMAMIGHRGAVSQAALVAILTPYCQANDTKVGGWDPDDNTWCEGTRLEKVIDSVLEAMATKGFLHYNEETKEWEATIQAFDNLWLCNLSWIDEDPEGRHDQVSA